MAAMQADGTIPSWVWAQLVAWSYVVPLVSGRILLAYLPPGRPGGHRAQELPATLAATLVGGLALGHGWMLWCGPGGIWIGLERSASAWSLAAASLVLVLLLLARVATLPGGFVPGPARARRPLARAHLALRWIAGLSILARVARQDALRGSDWGGLEVLSAGLQATLLLATVFAVDHALQEADSGERERSLIWVILGLAVWLVGERLLNNLQALEALFALAAAGSFLVGWWRRADRRAGVLCALALGLAIVAAPRLWWLGACGVVALVLGTAAGGRGLVGKACCAALVALVLPSVAMSYRSSAGTSLLPGFDTTAGLSLPTLLAGVAAPLVVLALGLLLAWGRPRQPAT